MLTPKQIKWINHLRNDDRVIIKPFDPRTPEIFESVKTKIQSALGKKTRVEHRGATSFRISGQDEIDIYIPIRKKEFNLKIPQLVDLFGEPGSSYPLERVRFKTIQKGKRVDIFLINEESDGWKNGVIFEKYLKSNPKSLEEYKILKEEGNGLPSREYYRRKIEFINKILAKTKKD